MTRAAAVSVSVLSCLIAAVPAAAQVTRVSVSSAGAEANDSSGPPSISADGRFVVFSSSATNLVAGDTNGVADIFLRDRDTDADGIFDEAGAAATTRISVGPGATQADAASVTPVISADGRYVAFLSTATNLVAGANAFTQVYRVDRTTGAIVRVSQDATGEAFGSPSDEPAIDADGDVVAFSSSFAIFIREVGANRTTSIASPFWGLGLAVLNSGPGISADGNRVAYLRTTSPPSPHNLAGVASVFDRATGTGFDVGYPINIIGPYALSASGRQFVARDGDRVRRLVVDTGAESAPLVTPAVTSFTLPAIVSPSARYVLTEGALLGDFALGISTNLGFVPGGGDFSDDDRWLAVVSGTNNLVGGDTNGVDDVFVVDLPDRLDADDDAMDDRLETLFGVTDPSADPDGDGQTNAQELAAGTHPNGQVQRFLAEGATGSFFRTAIALANPGAGQAAAVLTFDRGDGTRVRRSIGIPAGRSTIVDVGAVAGLETADVSTTIESDGVLGVQRSMTWGALPGVIYGSHAETATSSPSTTWFLAEGSTVLDFDLFYLLQNPQPTTTHATIRFLLPSGTVITRTYDLAPGSRTTIYVNQVAGLDETDVSGDITADAPIVVERAMYRNLPGQPFGLGTESMGVPAAATSWFLAEGATGTFFDLFVLIANPGPTDAIVEALYARPDGTTVTQTYTVRAHSRHSVYVDSIPGLDNTSVATTLTSTNGVPIVAERAMYWPGGFFDYYEGHSSAGSTTTALEWVVAGAQSGGQAQTFVLIANTENRAGFATIDLLPDVTSTVPPPSQLVLNLLPNSRTTVPVQVEGSYGVRVVSVATGSPAVQLVVESAVYRSDDGVQWSSGSNALATPVP